MVPNYSSALPGIFEPIVAHKNGVRKAKKNDFQHLLPQSLKGEDAENQDSPDCRRQVFRERANLDFQNKSKI